MLHFLAQQSSVLLDKKCNICLGEFHLYIVSRETTFADALNIPFSV
jgi:hypothetical protein